MDDNDVPSYRTNRIKSRQCRADHGFWCRGCDAHIVFEGQVCPTCKNEYHKNVRSGKTKRWKFQRNKDGLG